MIAERKSALVIDLRIPYSGVKDFLLLSDVHWDHPYCDRDLFYRLLDQAVERDARIMINGDFFCMMQARKDRRGSKDKVRPEHQGANYFNLVIEDAAEQLAKYASHIVFMGDGNHETAIVKHNEINPLDMLCTLLRHKTGHNILRQGYHGFIRFKYHFKNSAIRTKIMYHHHGKFGGIVTMGALGVKRHAAVIPDADIIWTGHTHDLWEMTHPRMKVDKTGNVITDAQIHIKTGTFKDEFNKPGGFGVERNYKPAAIGGYWLKAALYGQSQKLSFLPIKAIGI